LRKLGAQAGLSEVKRAVEGGSSAGMIQPPFRLVVAAVMCAYLRPLRVLNTADLSLQ
jgi:hypothetical protein